MHITNIKSLSKFIQILDSSFPSGSFVHSFGLEAHIVLEKVENENDLNVFLQNLILDAYIKFEFVFCRKVFELFKEDNLKQIIKEDNKYSTMLSYEFSKASIDLGYNFLKHLDFKFEKDIVHSYYENVKNKTSKGNELLILVAYAYECDLEIDLFLLLWCKKNIINISLSAPKISKIQPSKIQKILFSLDEFIIQSINTKNKNMENFNPLFEESIYQHNTLEPKLFAT